MTYKSKHPCSHPGCPALVESGKGGRCEKHKQTTQRSKESGDRYNNSRWKKYRIWFLSRHPLCVKCQEEGKVKESNEVDHIIPCDSVNDPLFWATENHQALCKSHHSQKTMKEMGSKTYHY